MYNIDILNTADMHFTIKLSCAILFLSVLLVGCENNFFALDESVKVRIENKSPYEMRDITVSFSGDEVEYGDLDSSEHTAYKEVRKAYRYAYIEVIIEGESIVLQPIDYVGEKILKSGNYTYSLNLHTETDAGQDGNPRYYLGLELKND